MVKRRRVERVWLRRGMRTFEVGRKMIWGRRIEEGSIYNRCFGEEKEKSDLIPMVKKGRRNGNCRITITT